MGIFTPLGAQWQSLNPGGGGQVQDVVADPNRPGRLYYLSDMEGIYRSDDHGESWHFAGRGLVHARTYCLAVTPGRGDLLFAGTLYGLHRSEDSGQQWRVVPETLGHSIGAVAVDPHAPGRILAGVGWSDDDSFNTAFGNLGNGPGIIVLSEDGGVTWERRTYDADETTSPNVHSVVFDPKVPGRIYLGSAKGVFRSDDSGGAWRKLPAPDGAFRGRGIALSPDGRYLYAAFETAANGFRHALYATAVSRIVWRDVTAGAPKPQLRYWLPATDPRQEGAAHNLLLPLKNEREGLLEGLFTWDGEDLIDVSWRSVFAGTDGYDTGWDFANPNPRFAHYTPPEWPRAIWTTGNQSVFQGVPSEAGGFLWTNKYSVPDTATLVWGRFPVYSSRGADSTFVYDFAVHGKYAIQGQGDNGWMESWDGGLNWTNMLRHRNNSEENLSVSDVQAVEVADAAGVPVVLAQGSRGFGGNAVDGRLYAKRLIHFSPADAWQLIAGGEREKGGIPNRLIREITADRHNTGRVFLGVQDAGIYVIDDLAGFISAGGALPARRISTGGADGIRGVRSIVVHPTRKDVIFVTSNGGDQGVFRGEEQPGGSWVWRKLFASAGWKAQIAATEAHGKVYLVHTGQWDDPAAGINRAHATVALSEDEGLTWRVVLTKPQVESLRGNDDWYPFVADRYRMQIHGLAVRGHEVVLAVYDHTFQKGYAVLRGEITPDGQVLWSDWGSEGLPLGSLSEGRIVMIEGKAWYYAGTQGAGLWRREFQ